MPYTYQYSHPAVTCLFTILDVELKILLIRRGLDPYKGDWALPGGFIRMDENLEAAWHPVDDLLQLAFDHASIINRAVKRVRAKTEYSTVAFEFLSEEFTVSDVRQVYETVQRVAIDKRNFQKWLMRRDLVEPTGERRTGSHRPAEFFRLKPAKRRTAFAR